MNNKMKTMVAAVMFATSIGVLATGDTYTGVVEQGTYADGAIQNGNNSGQYEAGAFNFTENSNQEVTSTINGGNVHGDSKTSSGDIIQVEEGGIYSTGSNAGYNAALTTSSGQVTDGGNLGGHFVTMEVPVYTYTEQFAPDVMVTQADVDADSSLVLGDVLTAGGSMGFNKVQDRNADGSPKTAENQVWTAYNSTEATLIASNNNLEAQRIAANSSTEVTQTVISAPSMSAPSINASNSDMCRHGVSGSASTLGLGFSAGMTLVDKNCELVKQVRLLNNLGLRDVALSLLGQDDRIAKAMRQADNGRYGRYLNDGTEVHTEAVSANAEAVANGKEVVHSVAGEDADKVNQNWNGSSDGKKAKSLGKNGYPEGDLMNLFSW